MPENRTGSATAAGLDRRTFMKLAAAAGIGAAATWERPALGAGPVVRTARFPEKTDLILLADRPPNLETPLKYFKEDITPNEAFFVRWHVSGIPTEIDTGKFRLKVSGHVGQELSLSVADLKKDFQPATVTAVR